MKPSLDIVIPLFNSSQTVGKLIDELRDYASKSVLDVRYILVDDGSTDNTYLRAQNSLDQISLSAQLIKLNKNYGQHTATAIGLSLSTSDFAATIDDDLQHHPGDLDQMYAHLQQSKSDLVYGNYQNKYHHPLRNLGTKILQKILLAGGKDYSLVTSYRLMTKSVASVFVSRQIKTHFIDDFLMEASSKVTACNVRHTSREHGKSGYTFWSLLVFAIKILILHSSVPLKLISRMGLIMSIVFFLFGCYYIYMKVKYDAAIGFTSLIVAIFFSTGLILFSLGIIGEYIRRIWISKQELDVVIIAEKSRS
jgi:glycosyltransferase involved in cell wall biosynthesis